MNQQELVKEIAGVIKKTFDGFELNHERVKSGWDKCVELLRKIVVNKLSDLFAKEGSKVKLLPTGEYIKSEEFNPSQFKKECGVE